MTLQCVIVLLLAVSSTPVLMQVSLYLIVYMLLQAVRVEPSVPVSTQICGMRPAQRWEIYHFLQHEGLSACLPAFLCVSLSQSQYDHTLCVNVCMCMCVCV